MTALDDRPVEAPPAHRTGRWAGRRAVLRLARRDAARHRARSALVIAMVALPVVGLAAVDVVARTEAAGATSSAAPRLPAGVDAQLQWYGGRVEQTPDGGAASIYEDRPAGPPSAEQVERDTGAAEALRVSRSSGRAELPGGRTTQVQLVEADLGAPLSGAVGEVVEGRAPRGPDEVAVSAALRAATGSTEGDVLRLSVPSRALTVVGTVRLVGEPAEDSQAPATVVGPAGSLLGGSTGVQDATYLLRTPTPLLWADVLRLNDLGYLVVSRAVLADPPADDEVPLLSAPQPSQDRLDVAAFTVLAAGMGLLEVVLLAGPAFAVGARRSRRVLALLAATGGDRRQVRDVVLAQGLVLGLVGAGVGLLVGVAVGAAALRVLERISEVPQGAPVLRPLDLLAIAAVGLVTAVLAALLPARGVSRQDVALALTGRREPVRPRTRVPVLGLLLAAAGLAVVLLGVGRRSALTILSGAALGQVGLVVCTPSVIRLLGRAAGGLPLTPRLAVRDAARNVGRTAPAVAAVLAAVAGTVASSIFVASLSERDERAYVPQLPVGQLLVQVEPGLTAADLAAVEQVVRAQVPVESIVPLRVTDGSGCADPAGCTTAFLEGSEQSPFGLSYGSAVAVDDGSGLPALLGSPSPAGVQALQDGGAVVLDPALVEDGVVQLRLGREGLEGGTAGELVGVEAVGVDVPGEVFLPAPVVLSPELAERLGLDAGLRELRVVPSRPVTQDEQDALGRTLADTVGAGYVHVERGFGAPYRLGLVALVVGAALVTVGAVATSTALAMIDARPDLATMAAVGASRSVRRRMAMTTALVLALLGTALGAVAGAVPAVAAISALRRDGASDLADGGWPLVVPWPSLLVTALVVPLAAGMLVALFTRSRLPVVHRRDA